MRYLLAAINAKYIHSNLGIYSLRRYAMERLGLEQKDEQGAAVGMSGAVKVPTEKETVGTKMASGAAEIQIDFGESAIETVDRQDAVVCTTLAACHRRLVGQA